MPSDAVNEKTREEWRALGFFYDVDHEAKVWTLVGSRAGLLSTRARGRENWRHQS